MTDSHRLFSSACRVAAIAAALFVASGAATVKAQESSSAEYSRSVDASPTPVSRALQGSDPRPVPAYGYPAGTGWVSHFAAEFGGGFTTPADRYQHDLTYGWNVVAGAGYKFDRHFSMLGEFQLDYNKIPAKVLAQVGEPGGNVRIESLTLDPVWNYKTSGSWGGYLTGGGGVYRKVTSFTEPALITSYYCDYFYCYPYDHIGNVVVNRFATNQAGANIGGGFTIGNWSGGKFYTEARYHWLDTPGRGTRIVPVTIGFRW